MIQVELTLKNPCTRLSAASPPSSRETLLASCVRPKLKNGEAVSRTIDICFQAKAHDRRDDLHVASPAEDPAPGNVGKGKKGAR